MDVVLFYITAKSKTDRSQGLKIGVVRKSEQPCPIEVWPYALTAQRGEVPMGGFFSQAAMKGILESVHLEHYENIGDTIAWWSLDVNESKFQYLGHHETSYPVRYREETKQVNAWLFNAHDLKSLFESVEETRPFEEDIPVEGTCYLVRVSTCGCHPRDAMVYGPYFARAKAEEIKTDREKNASKNGSVSVREWHYEMIHLADGRTWLALGDYLVRDTFVDKREDEYAVSSLDSFAEIYPGA